MPAIDSEFLGPADFPSTVWTRLIRGQDPRAAVEYLASRYWKPAYLYIRRRWRKSHEDAKDLTQEFFTQAIESGLLGKAVPERGSFRKFLRASIENFLRNEHRDAKALKRGGEAVIVPLDAAAADQVVSREGDPSSLFDREWLESVFELCLPRMRERYAGEGRPEYFEIFKRYEIERPLVGGPTYEDLARDFGLSVDDIRNRLTHARARWRKLVVDELRESVGTPGDLEGEVKDLFPA